MGRMERCCAQLQDESGSDLHLAAGQTPRMRRKGSLDAIEGQAPLDRRRRCARCCARSPATSSGPATSTQSDLDFAYGIPGVARFRANYFVQENGAGAVFRIIPEEIQTLEELALPPAIRELRAPRPRAGAGDGADRLGQVDLAGRGHQRDQRALRQAHRHDRGPDRVRAPEQEVGVLAARGRRARRRASGRRCAPRCARTPT